MPKKTKTKKSAKATKASKAVKKQTKKTVAEEAKVTEEVIEEVTEDSPTTEEAALEAPEKKEKKAEAKKEEKEGKKSWFKKKEKPAKEEAPKKKGFFGRKKKKNEDAEEVDDEDPENMTVHVREEKKVSGITGFITSINYLGMGKYRHAFVQSLAIMLGAGLSLIEALRAIQAESRSRAVKKLVGKIADSVEEGTPLWRAMEKTYFFTPYEIALVHIGEDAGNLSRNLEYLAEQQEKDTALKQKVKMAMIYPSIVMTMMFVIVMGLGIYVLPNLVEVLFSLNVDLPLTTRIVIRITRVFEQHGTTFAPLMIVGFIVIALLSKYTRFKAVTQWFIFRIPGIGTLAREATIARFGVIMGGLLRAGVPLVEALESLADVTQVVIFKRFYQKLHQRILVGDSFHKSFQAIKSTKKILPFSVQQLVVTGERSGSLSQTLLKVADIYEKKAQHTAEKLPVILEPVILLIIGGMVGTIAFAIITPIYSVVGNVG